MLLPWYYIPQMALVKANLYFVNFKTNGSYGKKELNLFMVYTTQISEAFSRHVYMIIEIIQ